jgi:Alkylmercury lyase
VPDLTTRDLEVRRIIYDGVMNSGTIPTRASLVWTASLNASEVCDCLERLAAAHMLVLQRDGEILMANPFSAVPTPFVVSIGGRSWYGNCIWDAMGIMAMMHRNGTIEASCGCCGTAMTIHVPEGCTADERRAHFALPAAKWWDDIVFN